MYLKLEEARNKKKIYNWDDYKAVKPEKCGITVFNDYPVSEIAEYIDWTPYFTGWGLKGRFPQILNKDKVGREAQRMFEEGKAMLNRIVEEELVKPQGVIGLFPANSSGNDEIIIYEPDNRFAVKKKIRMLRQQNVPKGNDDYMSLSDFVIPEYFEKRDYIGFFTVTAGQKAEDVAAGIKNSGDPYESVMFRLIADRITEAFAELLHLKVRKELWGYDKNENLSLEQLIKEEYKGIRPAPGYPACPDHALKTDIFSVLNVEDNIGVTLTKDLVMKPVSSVTGFYISHPESKYFRLGKITTEQLEDYAGSKSMPLKNAEKLLKANINYEAEFN